MRTSSSPCSSAASHYSAHTVNDRCCCNIPIIFMLTWQIITCFNTVNGKDCCICLVAYSCCNSIKIKMKRSAFSCFNTVNGRCCCLITFVLPSLRSGTCNVWASSSLRSSAASHSAAHTVNGKDYFNAEAYAKWVSNSLLGFNTVNGRYCCNEEGEAKQTKSTVNFNTVNGRYCCNVVIRGMKIACMTVSIP